MSSLVAIVCDIEVLCYDVKHVVVWRLLFKCVGFVYACVITFVGHEDDYGITCM